MDDATAGPRIRAIRTQLDQLTARREDLADTNPPGPHPKRSTGYAAT
jgi:hypothetical protein